MSYRDKNPRQIVDQFLGEMGRPVSEEQSDRAVSSVLERLQTESAPVLDFAVTAAKSPSARSGMWRAVAAAAVVMLAGALLPILLQRSVNAEIVAKPVGGEIHAVGKSAAFLKYSRIEAGRVVKAGEEGGAVTLVDGSQIEMSPEAVLSVVRETDGLRVRLSSGIVLVSAARQRNGNLYVETKDCVVSVTGTVFAVSAEAGGSSVTVLEGEVQVQSGEVSRTLLAGEQASTSAQSLGLPGQTDVAPASPERLAMAQQQSTPGTLVAPPAGNAIRGVVSGSTGAGIPDITVGLCINAANAETAQRLDDAVSRGGDGPILRNKAFFFAIWDAARGCTPTTSVVTDSTGRFEFSNVSAGDYTVRAEREGFSGPRRVVGNGGILRYFAGWNQTHEVRVSLSGDSKSVRVTAQQPTQDVSLTLIRAGVIAGRVRDAEGRILVNARVQVLTVPGPGDPDGINVITVTTNDLGEYRAYWLSPGEYHVLANASGQPRWDTWFPGGATVAEANAVVVREGETVSNIDITVRPTPPDAATGQPGAPGGRR